MTDARATVAVRMAIRGNIIERLDVDDVIDVVTTRLKGGIPRGLAVGSVNLDHLHHFGDDSALGVQPGPEWLLLADGMPIAWRGQLLTSAPWPRVTGADLLPRILQLAEQRGHRIGFLGGTTETLGLLSERLAEQYPRIKIAGTWSPDPDELEARSADIAAEIRAARTEILVVSLGKPRQERWIVKYGTATGADVFLPFGAAVDFFAGTKRRAPGWMQRVGLEWFYRLSREPRRLARRYLIQGPAALVQAVRAKLIHAPGVYYAAAPTTHDPSRSAPLPQRVTAGERRAVGADSRR
ncbi:WecB/TagA/CpsF family glycosyltransferase [Mycobacterium deserti]|uniref:WecB/TagA/CpsF family glycosyltransferase n=1 Tax=Mycobacterium deserti TaxID=2978347 RepID=A0ABT2MD07_9MYCO|nr:WecB/TagA/CpsF family glycosyltransferase [Mycobacterium deserti]MCT7660158.1 WecB/TagA/CpsF family glycosyltransferase [Mycobacterium deserti]